MLYWYRFIGDHALMIHSQDESWIVIVGVVGSGQDRNEDYLWRLPASRLIMHGLVVVDE